MFNVYVVRSCEVVFLVFDCLCCFCCDDVYWGGSDFVSLLIILYEKYESHGQCSKPESKFLV